MDGESRLRKKGSENKVASQWLGKLKYYAGILFSKSRLWMGLTGLGPGSTLVCLGPTKKRPQIKGEATLLEYI